VSKQPCHTQTNFFEVDSGFVVQVYLSAPTLVTAFCLEQATPVEILAAAMAGAIDDAVAIKSAAKATVVLRNIIPPCKYLD
jgi:hypothetical protein